MGSRLGEHLESFKNHPSATGLRPHEPGQLLAQSLRFVYSVFPMTRAWLARRRAAPHGRAALRAAFGGGRRFAPPSAAGRRSARLGETARLARALGLEVGASGDFMHLPCVHGSEIKVFEQDCAECPPLNSVRGWHVHPFGKKLHFERIFGRTWITNVDS